MEFACERPQLTVVINGWMSTTTVMRIRIHLFLLQTTYTRITEKIATAMSVSRQVAISKPRMSLQLYAALGSVQS